MVDRFFGLWISKKDNIQKVIDSGVWVNKLTNQKRVPQQMSNIKIGDKVFLFSGIEDVELEKTPYINYIDKNEYSVNIIVKVKSFAIGEVKRVDLENSSLYIKWDKSYTPNQWYSYYRQDGIWQCELKNNLNKNQKEKYLELYKMAFEGKQQDYKWWIDKGILNRYKKSNIQTKDFKISNINIKNIILYGSPGVGKTHNTNKLIRLIENGKSDKEIFETIKSNESSDSVDISDIKDRVKFVTFHQSFGYEDFIEGFRPNDEGDIELIDGIFKEITNQAKEKNISIHLGNELQEKLGLIKDKPTIWKISLGERGEIKEKCFENNYIRIGWDKYGNLDNRTDIPQRELKDFYNLEIGDIIFVFKNQWEIDGIGIVTEGYKFIDKYDIYKHQRGIEWIIKNKTINIAKYNKNIRMTLSTLYRLSRISKNDVLEIIQENTDNRERIHNKRQNYYLIIDEINRANISKVFGELITLIEEDKRDKLEVTLPYSKESFSIPSNLYIIGTMNSTDKSIALIDIALRRRFTFLKMEPNADLIDYQPAKEIFEKLNKQIKQDLGEDYQIGHSYFMQIADEDDLDFVLEYKIKPLLEEYFYGDDRLNNVLEIINR